MRAAFMGLISILLCGVTSSAYSDDSATVDPQRKYFLQPVPNPLFASLNKLKVIINDQVKDGCFTNQDAVKTAVELSLRRNGFDVVDPNVYADEVDVNLVGYKTMKEAIDQNACAVFADVILVINRPVIAPYVDGKASMIAVSLEINGSLFTGGGMNARLKEFAGDSADELSNYVLKARSTMKATYPAEFQLIESGLKSSN